MEGYLGEKIVENKYSKEEMALKYIEMYGGIDGAHHKNWVLDQVSRILNDAPVVVKVAEWSNGKKEERYAVGSNQKYENWVINICDGEDGPNTYSYEEGIAP